MAMVWAWCRKRFKIAPAVGTFAQKLAPFLQGPVAGHDGGPVFILVHDYLKKMLTGSHLS